jgi:phosphoribosyl-ATP pyrophosphohydrolase/phosphoribosyl-AMP cyclohydrolase
VPASDSDLREVLDRVVAVIRERKAGRGATNAEGKSYVRTLMDKGADEINEKIAEECAELCRALRSESDERVANEAADLIFHVLVGLVHRDLDLDPVAAVLRGRFGVSGIDEKASRD